jgi:bifunctional non-homologous end joining protein LigD
VERKSHLKKLITKTAIQFSESLEVDGRMYDHACSVGLEGVVSKVRDSRYPAGRGDEWVKRACAQRETLRIAGYMAHPTFSSAWNASCTDEGGSSL